MKRAAANELWYAAMPGERQGIEKAIRIIIDTTIEELNKNLK